ncbi:MAG TPA: hypothetical protein PLE82_06075 [Saccharofermentans sp.]|nr:hypothetical protein [Saccharofermentans sp.]
MRQRLPDFIHAKQFNGHEFDLTEDFLKDAVIEFNSATATEDSYLTLITVYGDLRVSKGSWICRTNGEYFVLHTMALECLTKMKHGDQIPDLPSELQEASSLPENLWELYNSVKSYSNTNSGTFEFNQDGEITKAIVTFKK